MTYKKQLPRKFMLGVDPGKTGGYCILDSKGYIQTLRKFEDWQTIFSHTQKYPYMECCIEHAHAVSEQGVKSIFTYGMNYGGWLAFLDIFSVDYTIVHPTVWQPKILGMFPPGESKKRSLRFVMHKYSHLNLKANQHGLSDAVCIALYCLINAKKLK